MIELGDGLLGAYGVEAILTDAAIRRGIHGRRAVRERSRRGMGRRKILREQYGIEPAVVTGPATDNAVGIDQICARGCRCRRSMR